MNSARDCLGLVHRVIIDDDNEREYGQVACGTWFYWRMSPMGFDVEIETRERLAYPMNPTREKVTCLECIAVS